MSFYPSIFTLNAFSIIHNIGGILNWNLNSFSHLNRWIFHNFFISFLVNLTTTCVQFYVMIHRHDYWLIHFLNVYVNWEKRRDVPSEEWKFSFDEFRVVLLTKESVTHSLKTRETLITNSEQRQKLLQNDRTKGTTHNVSHDKTFFFRFCFCFHFPLFLPAFLDSVQPFHINTGNVHRTYTRVVYTEETVQDQLLCQRFFFLLSYFYLVRFALHLIGITINKLLPLQIIRFGIMIICLRCLCVHNVWLYARCIYLQKNCARFNWMIARIHDVYLPCCSFTFRCL